MAVGPKMQATSEAIPFLEKPKNLNGQMAGDVGFDPLGFSDSYDLKWLQVCKYTGRNKKASAIGTTIDRRCKNG